MKWSLILTIVVFIASLLAVYFHLSQGITFVLLILTLVLGSRLMGNATEELANYYSSTAGGLLNATLGNLAELIIGFFALKEGLVNVVQASLTGSIMGNILLVFGISAFVGGLKKKECVLNKNETEISSTMLLISSFLLLIPSALFIFHESKYEVNISYIVAVLLFVLYICSIVFSFVTHKKYFLNSSKEKPKMSKAKAFFLLIGSIAVIVVASELFAGRIESIAHALGWGELFIGAVLVGIVGNAAEHLGAVQFALHNKMSLVLNTTIGSSLQIAMFVSPVLVFASYFLGAPMTLAFLPIEIFAIVLSVFLMNEISKDGAVNWIEGLQLIVFYIVLAFLFFYYF